MRSEIGAPRVKGQRGASLLFVLMLVVLGGIVAFAVAAFANTSASATKQFNEVRADRYNADGALKGAINWIKDQPDLAIDPDYDPDYDPDSTNGCAFESEGVTVTCETVAGSGSGVPPEQGDLPPETVLLLGTRHTEPGPYSYSNCDSVWDSVYNFFTGFTNGAPETSFLAQKSKRSSGWLNLGTCTDRARGSGPIKIQGNMVAAGRVQANSGMSIQAIGEDGGPGTIRARHGCVNITCAGWLTNRSAPGKPWHNTPADSDPARPSGGSAFSPFGDLRSEFLPIGFQADGTLRDGYSLPVREHAYVYDRTANTAGTATVPKYLRPISSCAEAGAGTPIIFLPGWYKRSEVLSAYTGAVNSCMDRTFWFPPNAGPDKELLTADDETGAFYMDFRGSAASDGRACGTMAKPSPMTTAVAARWCLGGSGNASYNTKPRVVVGWPQNWEPFPAAGTAGPGSPEYGTPVPISLDTANRIGGNFLSYWSNTDSAKVIDGTYATYAPCQFWILTCPTLGQRTLRIENFTPKVTGSPIAETGAPNGRLRVELRYGMQHREALGTPWLDIDVLDEDGVAVSCGSYEMVNNSTVDFNGVGSMPASKRYVFTDAQAKTLADNCGSVEKINNMRLSIRVAGNVLNNPLSKIFVDGARIYYNSYQGASFPVGEDNAYNSTKKAKSDCDVTKPGGQLIFGGESHVYVADGSLEVCGGPDPDNPADAQVIGIYGVPATTTLRPSSVSSGGGDNVSFSGGFDSVKRIGEPDGRQQLTISYGGGTLANREGRVNITFPSVTLPAGYVVDKVEARASYNSKNPGDWMGIGSNAHLVPRHVNGSWCGAINMPLTGDLLQAANITKSDMNLTLFDSANPGSSCIHDASNPTNPLATARQFQWKARAYAVWPVNYFDDVLEGVELDVTLKPADASTPRLRPQSGCIIAHPNYTGGEGTPDCALVRAEMFDSNDSSEGVPVRGKWVGRMSVKGTIYAPSSAVEIDDNDIGYPFATRGVILRHLRMSGAKARTGYTEPWFGGDIDTDPAARHAVLTACAQTPEVRALPLSSRAACGDNPGDRVLAKAGVSFLTPETAGQNQANAPVVQWWSDRVTKGSA